MPGMSTVSTGSPRPTRCQGSCGGSGDFGAFGALVFLDLDFLRSLVIALSRSYRAVPELSRVPEIASALHCSLLVTPVPGLARPQRWSSYFCGTEGVQKWIAGCEGTMNRATAADAACLLGMPSVLHAASPRFLPGPAYCSHNSRAAVLWHRIDRTSPARTAPHAAKAAVHRCTARTAARRARRALQR